MFAVWLPIEILEYIISYLKVRDIIRCGQVCKQWRKLVNTEKIWKQMCDKLIDYFDTFKKCLTVESDVCLIISKIIRQIRNQIANAISYERIFKYWIDELGLWRGKDKSFEIEHHNRLLVYDIYKNSIDRYTCANCETKHLYIIPECAFGYMAMFVIRPIIMTEDMVSRYESLFKITIGEIYGEVRTYKCNGRMHINNIYSTILKENETAHIIIMHIYEKIIIICLCESNMVYSVAINASKNSYHLIPSIMGQNIRVQSIVPDL